MSNVGKMTRKQALLYAIEHLRDNPEVVDKLTSMYNDMPMCHWSKEACEDAIEQFYIERGRYPNISDLDRYTYLPSHPTVKNRFGISAREFLSRYNDKVRRLNKEEALRQFIAEYKRVGPFTAKMYNKGRGVGVSTWQYVARLWEIKSWSELVKFSNVEPVVKQKEPTQFNITVKGGVWEWNRRIAEINERIKNS